MDNLNEYGVCALCEQKNTLRESHIIPKFVGKWLKESGTGFLVSAEDGSRRVQDIAKIHLLCDTCEGRFSKFERYFANEIFFPFHQQKVRAFEYDKDLELFIVSLSWRALKITCEDFKSENPHLSSFIDKAEVHWREFLMGRRQSVNPYENHFLFLDYVKPGTGIPSNLDWYTLRAVDSTIVASGRSKRILVYVKFPWMVFVSTVNPTTLNGWHGTKIKEKGKINNAQSIEDGVFGQFLLNRASIALNTSSGPSIEVSQRRLQRVIETNPQKFLESDTFETIIVERDSLRKQRMKDMPKSVIAIVEEIMVPYIGDPHLSKAVRQTHRWNLRIVADIISNLSKEEAVRLDTEISSAIEKHRILGKNVQTTFKTNSLWITFIAGHGTTKEYQQSKIVEEINRLVSNQTGAKIPIAVFSINTEEDGVSPEFGFSLNNSSFRS